MVDTLLRTDSAGGEIQFGEKQKVGTINCIVQAVEGEEVLSCCRVIVERSIGKLIQSSFSPAPRSEFASEFQAGVAGRDFGNLCSVDVGDESIVPAHAQGEAGHRAHTRHIERNAQKDRAVPIEYSVSKSPPAPNQAP